LLVRAAVNRGTAEAAIIVSTVLYVEWGRLGEIGDLCVLPERRRHGLTRLLIEHRRPGPTSTGSPATAKTIGIVDDDRAPPKVRFATDSSLEQVGFEPSVPH
jgi:GNAT superfamily N-acetyltransferase